MKVSQETLETWKGIQASKATIFAVASKEANRLKESSKFKTDKESANFFFTWRSRIYGCLKGEQKFDLLISFWYNWGHKAETKEIVKWQKREKVYQANTRSHLTGLRARKVHHGSRLIWANLPVGVAGIIGMANMTSTT